MDSHNDSDITGLYGRCPHCNWSLKAKSGESAVACDGCKKTVNILNGQFVVPGASSAPSVSRVNPASIGCIVAAAILIVLAMICMSGGSNDSPDYTPITSSGGSRGATQTDVRNNPCYLSCAKHMSAHPDEIAPQCRNVTPMSEYQKCIQGAAASIGE